MSASPTGLDHRDLEGLSERKLRRLAAWHQRVAGDDEGRAWWGASIRSLSLDDRLGLAQDEAFHSHWVHAERLRCASDPHHFIWGYGHVQPEEGPPLPFDPWPEQRDVLDLLIEELRLVVLKARQLGLTWLALHFGYWLLALSADTPNARILCLSKIGGDATKLLARARRINDLLPPFLRGIEANATATSLTRFKLVGRGEMISLMGTPDAARSETATFALADEFGHYRNRNAGPTLTALQPTLGQRGRLCVIGTGNGPPDVDGDGQAFAATYADADAGRSDFRAVFLPSSVHPERTPEWRERERERYLSDEAFEAEYPNTAEQALQGHQGDKVYPLSGIAAAERFGAEFDALLAAGEMPDPAGASDGDIAPGMDWGSFSHLLTIWELEGGGIYVPPGAVSSFGEEVTAKTEEYLEGVRDLVQEPHSQGEEIRPLISEARFDSAGIEQMRSAIKFTLERPHLRKGWHVIRTNNPAAPMRLKTLSVRFNAYKAETIEYLRWLFIRSAKAASGGPRWGIIAISPENEELLRQLRALEFLPDGTGRIRKLDDHGPDALIAGAAPIAAQNRGRAEPGDDDVNEEPEGPRRAA